MSPKRRWAIESAWQWLFTERCWWRPTLSLQAGYGFLHVHPNTSGFRHPGDFRAARHRLLFSRDSTRCHSNLRPESEYTAAGSFVLSPMGERLLQTAPPCSPPVSVWRCPVACWRWWIFRGAAGRRQIPVAVTHHFVPIRMMLALTSLAGSWCSCRRHAQRHGMA